MKLNVKNNKLDIKRSGIMKRTYVMQVSNILTYYFKVSGFFWNC